MCDVIGPNSYLPGQEIKAKPGARCVNHTEEIPATHRIVGETDSFGSELIDLCEACYQEHLTIKKQPITGDCDWCGTYSDSLTPKRDIEEGSHGRVYDVCPGCLEKERKRHVKPANLNHVRRDAISIAEEDYINQ